MLRFFNFRLWLAVLLFFSCAQNSRENQTPENETPEMEGVLSPSREDFVKFLDKFNNEAFFQRKRIVFPLKALVSDLKENGYAPVEETIGKYDWELLDLTYDSTYAERDCDRYLQKTVFRGDTAVVQVRGIDNDIYADYYFALISDKWFLVALMESSF